VGQRPRHHTAAQLSLHVVSVEQPCTHAGAAECIDQVEPEAFLGDKGYDSNALVETLEERGIIPVIPPKVNRRAPRQTDFALYRERNLVERFFCKLKQYRAISTRYDKLANTFLAAVALVCVLFWLN
jgi:transposase